MEKSFSLDKVPSTPTVRQTLPHPSWSYSCFLLESPMDFTGRSFLRSLILLIGPHTHSSSRASPCIGSRCVQCLRATPGLPGWAGSHCRCVSLQTHWELWVCSHQWGSETHCWTERNLLICSPHSTPLAEKVTPPLKHLNCFLKLNRRDWKNHRKHFIDSHPDILIELKLYMMKASKQTTKK